MTYRYCDGSLHRMVSHMGKSKTKTTPKERVFYKTLTHQPNLRTKKRNNYYSEFRSKKRRNNKDERFEKMELLRGVYALCHSSHVTIDNPVFRLHTNTTFILLVTFSIAVTTRQYVGNPIDCVHTKDIPEDVLNTYCWIHSTFTLLDDDKKPTHDGHIPGVQTTGKHPIKQVRYYQWVAFFLFFQILDYVFKTQDKFAY